MGIILKLRMSSLRIQTAMLQETRIVAATAEDTRGKKEVYRSDGCLGGYQTLGKVTGIIESNGKSDGEKGNDSDGILDGEFEWIFLIENWNGYAVFVCVFVVM